MAEIADKMSPEASPGFVRKSGVRRVNNLPIIIAAVALSLFVSIIAMVAVKRANSATHMAPDVPQSSHKNTDTSTMANNIVDGRPISSVHQNAPANLLDAPRDDLAFEWASTTENSPIQQRAYESPQQLTATDTDEQQIRIAKRQQFHEAVTAKSAISLPALPNSAGINVIVGNTLQTREEMLARIAQIHKQIAQTNAVDSNTAYQEQLVKAQAMLAESRSGEGGVSSLPVTGGNNTLQPFSHGHAGDRWALNQEVQKPRSPFEIRAGGVIPGVMISGVNSDLPGQIMGQVSQDIYDTATGKYMLIPHGTRLIGSYSSDVGYGQSAVLIAWQRLIFPDGKALDIGAMPGADGAGYTGFRDQVNNHYVRLFGSAFLMSGITAGISYSQDRNNSTGLLSQPTAGSELSKALGQQLGQVAAQMIAKNLNIAPTLEIRPGYRFNIVIVKDLTFTKPYKSFSD